MTGGAETEAAERWLPEDARLIALVREEHGGSWAAGVAVGLADMVGRRRGRTILANVAGGSEDLDRLLGAEGGPGLSSALTGAASVRSIARSRREQQFVYLPAGEAALTYSGLRRMESFRRFLAKVRDGGGTLLLYVGEENLRAGTSDEASVPSGLDGCIALGEARGAAAGLEVPLLARVERPAPPPGRRPDSHEGGCPDADGGRESMAADGPTSTAAAATGGSRRPGSLSRLLLPVAALAIGFGAWAVARPGPGSSEGAPSAGVSSAELPPEVGGERRVRATGARDAAAETPTEAAGAREGEGTGRPPGAADAARAAGAVEGGRGGSTSPERDFAAPPARYSVLVGSYIRLEDAMARRAELAAGGDLFYVVPTPVRGRIYYRVLAGVHEDRADAAVLMGELVAGGRKDAVKEWDIRPVRLAFDLGTFAERNAADLRARALRGDGVPAYILRDTAEAPLYRVYAGAFTSADDAGPTARLLDEMEGGAELITRSGVAP